MRAPIRSAVVLAAALGGGESAVSHGQVSPGPLARAHADLDVATECFRCHGRKNAPLDQRCRDCHREIDVQLTEGTGLHGREDLQACARCHPDHGGREFDLIEWPGGSPETFDHDRTGWALEGRHRLAACRDCHRAKYRVSPVAGTTEGGKGSASWLGLTPGCVGCHEDVHRGALGATCSDCHSARTFSPAPGFDHARTEFPLTGRHTDVPCRECHREPESPGAPGASVPALRYAGLSNTCVACHSDPHAGQLGARCAECHVTTDFRKVARSAFDHGRTRFPLRGRHADVPCAGCHRPGAAHEKQPRHATCGSCHADAHAGRATIAGKPADCAACHDERSFARLTFTRMDHAASAYPLEGRHLGLPCEACHARWPAAIPAGSLGTSGVHLRPEHGTCTDCHADAHAGQLRGREDGGACEACHDVGGFSPSLFTAKQHAAQGFPLDGGHAEAACGACHGPLRHDLSPLPAQVDPGTARVALKGIETECAACHLDVHEGRLGPECGDCHDTRRFHPSLFDTEQHEESAFPLRGAHRATPCVACHEALGQPAADIRLLSLRSGRRPLGFRTTRERCSDCHASPHGSQFAHRDDRDRCESCHGELAFRPATRFDHDTTPFPLDGAHRAVACDACHPAREAEDGTRSVLYRPVSHRCRDCHLKSDEPGGGPS